VYVFGSYARGALTVGDVDVDIEYDAKLDPGVDRELVDNLVVGRDWNTPFRKALEPSRSFQVLFSRLEMIAEPVLIYQRGDTLDHALARRPVSVTR
jgi:predicted nucleotidyltransferase